MFRVTIRIGEAVHTYTSSAHTSSAAVDEAFDLLDDLTTIRAAVSCSVMRVAQ